jgi:hypothetical protein
VSWIKRDGPSQRFALDADDVDGAERAPRVGVDPGNSGRFDEMIREAFGYGWHRRSKADLRAGGQHDASAWSEARPLSSSIAI